MLKSIKDFFISINPEIIVQAPSRINLINPLDAVEGDFWMPSVAINGFDNPLSSFLYLKSIKKPSMLKIYKIQKVLNKYEINIEAIEELTKDIRKVRKKILGKFNLIYASIYRFYKTNSNFWESYTNQSFEIGLLTTIPRQSGLGGSSALIISIIYGFAHYFNLYNKVSSLKQMDFPINKDIIAEMATKVEDKDLKITAGYSDRYVISRGGLCYCSYFGKLFHEDISKEPLAVYDRIDKIYNIKDLPIIICYSGVIHESGKIHDKLRKTYLQGDPKILENYEKLAIISWKSRFALMRKDWKLLGNFFKENTKIMNQIMNDAGFEYGIGLANNILIKIIEGHPDVYAAKLTGAGGGGSVFALVNPDKINKILLEWKKRLNILIMNEDNFIKRFPTYPLEIKSQLRNAEFYRIMINQNGVSIIYSEKEQPDLKRTN